MKRMIFALLLATACMSWAFYANATEVPFLSQAPLNQWKDLRQAQGCEEAVALMALAWVRDQTSIDPKVGRDYIVDMSDWQKRYYGNFVDTSIPDSAARLLKHYIGIENFRVKENISVQDIKEEVAKGFIVITAIDGRKIGNVHYRNGGPRHHELLVTGYDTSTDMFVVNDPGTYKGKGLRIKSSVLQSALKDYPSGNGSSLKSLPPAMITVYK